MFQIYYSVMFLLCFVDIDKVVDAFVSFLPPPLSLCIDCIVVRVALLTPRAWLSLDSSLDCGGAV